MGIPLAARFVYGTVRRAFVSWRAGRLSFAPRRWLNQSKALYEQMAFPPPRPPVPQPAGPLPPYPAATCPAPSGVLLITDAVPTPDRDSGSFRLVQMLAVLREIGHAVTLAVDVRDPVSTCVTEVSELEIPMLQGRDVILRHLSEEGSTYKYVVLSRPDVAFQYLFPVRAYAIQARVVYDSVDLHWVRFRRGGELAGDEALLRKAEHYQRLERFNIAGADVTLAVTATERETIHQEVPAAHVDVCPNVHPDVASSVPWTSREGLMFIGSFWHAPNGDAVRYFVTEILPLIRLALPDVPFSIVGSSMPPDVLALASEHVHPLGYVPDPGPVFERSRVFVSPLRYGAGMKGKIGQSMSHGLPVVTTSIGAEGMGLVDGDHALVADTPEAFARAVIRLYTDRDLWERLSAQGRAHISRHFSKTAARERLQSLFPLASETIAEQVGPTS